jgi:hypothetical protein
LTCPSGHPSGYFRCLGRFEDWFRESCSIVPHREDKGALSPDVDGEPDVLRRRPREGPERGAEIEAELMPGGKVVGGEIELEVDVDEFADGHGGRLSIGVPMAQVEQSSADLEGGSVGGNIAETRGNLSNGAIDREAKLKAWESHHGRRGGGVADEAEGRWFLEALIRGQLSGLRVSPPTPLANTDRDFVRSFDEDSRFA